LFLFVSPKHRYLLIACGVLSLFSGCGSEVQVVKDRAHISGTVTFNGQPLPAGTIGLKDAEGPVSTSAMIKDGAYSTDRAPVGKNLVTIDTASIQFGNPAKFVPIPARYNDSSTSGLTADVQPGNNENVDFALEK
jgi:hypothetical protein